MGFSAPNIVKESVRPLSKDVRASLRSLHAFQRAQLIRGQYLAARAMRLPALSFRDLAVEHTQLAPAETLPYVAPRMREGHLARIESGFEGEAPDAVIARLQRREWSHEATVAYTLRDVALLGSRLFAGRSCHDLDRGRMPSPQEVESFDEVVLAASYAGSHWFGHCIHDDFPMQLLAAELGLAVAQAREPYGDEDAYRAAFAVPKPRVVPGFVAKRCTIVVDFAQNASKRARYARMRSNLPTSSYPAGRVYIQRQGGDLRVLREEAQLIEALATRGFTILRNGVDSPERFVEVCARATQVVTVDGSHAAPAMLIAPHGSEFFDISPPHRVTDTMVNIAQAAGLKTALYVGERGAGGAFSVDLDNLLGFIDEHDASSVRYE